MEDSSNRYEQIATQYIAARANSATGIGVPEISIWGDQMKPGDKILDLGCGTGLPVARIFVDRGIKVFGVDASPIMVAAFRQNFPDEKVRCEPIENSSFFNQTFDAAIAWGLMFLLHETLQQALISRVGATRKKGGEFLFTAPAQITQWQDVLTKQSSQSLGKGEYQRLLAASGMTLIGEFHEKGENHYYQARKHLSFEEDIH